ncbi:MAG TPA: hypothetical protein VKU84_00100 [Stellaceae bacterium]|nr:hypothetical protein [Stellaceae bacterium]
MARVGHAQQIPVTIATAEAEGAAFHRDAVPATLPEMFDHRPFGGSSERRCVASVPDDSLAGGSLRSGEVIARTHFTGWWGLRADKQSKIAWFPLHAPARHSLDPRASILIRAARLGDPGDTLRQTISGLTRGGFPSLVQLRAPGPWLVVATSGSDWGCFVLDVADPKNLSTDSR